MRVRQGPAPPMLPTASGVTPTCHWQVLHRRLHLASCGPQDVLVPLQRQVPVCLRPLFDLPEAVEVKTQGRATPPPGMIHVVQQSVFLTIYQPMRTVIYQLNYTGPWGGRG